MTAAPAAPTREVAPSDRRQHDRGWNIVVWNDPVNLMSYVVWVFRKVFGYPKGRATELMLTVHRSGRAVVATAPREQAEVHVHRLHHHGLWATMERA